MFCFLEIFFVVVSRLCDFCWIMFEGDLHLGWDETLLFCVKNIVNYFSLFQHIFKSQISSLNVENGKTFFKKKFKLLNIRYKSKKAKAKKMRDFQSNQIITKIKNGQYIFFGFSLRGLLCGSRLSLSMQATSN